MWFGHASFGYCGSLNDNTVLDLSPFLASLVDGSFCQKEKNSGLMPSKIGQEKFNQLYILVDDIYPSFFRFVNGMKAPVYSKEKKFKSWQEAARLDVERAFGVLQKKFQYMDRAVQEHDLEFIGRGVKTCLILHNMAVVESCGRCCCTIQSGLPCIDRRSRRSGVARGPG